MNEEYEIRTSRKFDNIHELAAAMEDEDDPFLDSPRYGQDYGQR